MEKEKRGRTWLFVGTGAVGVLMLTTGAYVLKFHRLSISENPDDWAAFGTYSGGVAGPILTLLTIVFLILQAVHERHIADIARKKATQAEKDAERRIQEEVDRQKNEHRISQTMIYLEWTDRDLFDKWEKLNNHDVYNLPTPARKKNSLWQGLFTSYVAFLAVQKEILTIDPDNTISLLAKKRYGETERALKDSGFIIPGSYEELIEELREEENDFRAEEERNAAGIDDIESEGVTDSD